MVSIMMRPNYTKTGLEAVIRTVEMQVMIKTHYTAVFTLCKSE